MKKTFLFMLTAIVFGACQESMEDRCEREAKEFTRKNFPTMMTEDIRMDSMTFERSTHTIHYYYALTGSSDRADSYDKEDVKVKLRDGLKNITTLQTYKDEGYNFEYTYRSEKDPKVVYFNVLLTKKDY
jgi:hypothetical protein